MQITSGVNGDDFTEYSYCDAGIPLGLLLSTSLRHVVCFYSWLGGSSLLLYALGTASLLLFALGTARLWLLHHASGSRCVDRAALNVCLCAHASHFFLLKKNHLSYQHLT